MKKTLAVLALATIGAIGGGEAAQAIKPPNKVVIVGEFEKVTVDLEHGDRLDVAMYPRRYRNLTVNERCANMGGDRLVQRRWKGRTYWVCQDVDF